MRLHVPGLILSGVFFLTYTIVATWAACICPPEVAYWEAPCGQIKISTTENEEAKSGEEMNRIVDQEVDLSQPKIWRKMIAESLKIIKQEIRSALYDLKNHQFQILYQSISGTISNNRQYIPSWLPGRGDVEILSVELKVVKEIPKSLQIFYTDLQKFAVAFEQISEDEKHEEKSKAISDIKKGLRLILCEVKSTLENLQMSVPMAVERSIMSVKDRIIPETPYRLIRDYGTIKRYGDYLQQWLSLLKSIRRRRKRSSQKQPQLPQPPKIRNIMWY